MNLVSLKGVFQDKFSVYNMTTTINTHIATFADNFVIIACDENPHLASQYLQDN